MGLRPRSTTPRWIAVREAPILSASPTVRYGSRLRSRADTDPCSLSSSSSPLPLQVGATWPFGVPSSSRPDNSSKRPTITPALLRRAVGVERGTGGCRHQLTVLGENVFSGCEGLLDFGRMPGGAPSMGAKQRYDARY
jgi:hypothetical protein